MVRYTSRTGLLLVGFTLAGCQVETANNETDTPVKAQQRPDADIPPILPAVEAPLTRRDLLLAAVEAASDHAAGVDDGEDVEEGLLTVGDVAFAVLDEDCWVQDAAA